MIKQDPKYLVDFLNVNVNNEKFSDAEFREVVRRTLPVYQGFLADPNEERPRLPRSDYR